MLRKLRKPSVTCHKRTVNVQTPRTPLKNLEIIKRVAKRQDYLLFTTVMRLLALFGTEGDAFGFDALMEEGRSTLCL